MADRGNTTSLVEEHLEPDFEALQSVASDLLETVRLLGKSAEHGISHDSKGYFLMLLRRAAEAAKAFPGARFQSLSQELERVSNSMREERESLASGRLRKRL